MKTAFLPVAFNLALYSQDGNTLWVDLASQNVRALADRLREGDGGYAYRAYRCMDRLAKGCEAGPPTVVVDRTRDTSAQAWVQHLQTALAHASTV